MSPAQTGGNGTGFTTQPTSDENITTDSNGNLQAPEKSGELDFGDYFKKATGGMTVEKSIDLYKERTGNDLTVQEVEKLFTDHNYAKELLLEDKGLHLVEGYRGILNNNAPRVMTKDSMPEGWSKLPWYKSIFHNPWYNPFQNSKYVGPGGHMEGVYDNKGNWVSDNKYVATFNFFGPDKAKEHWAADVEPYQKWGN